MLDLKEIYIVAKKNISGGNPVAEDIYNERFYFSRSEAERIIEDEFAPFMRSEMCVFAASLSIGNETMPSNFTLPALNDVPSNNEQQNVSTSQHAVSFEKEFLDQHKSSPSTNQSDYYFQMIVDPVDGDRFIITPKAFFDKTGLYIIKDSVPQTILPNGFSEFSDGIYEFSGNVSVGRLSLVSNGFTEHTMSQ